MRDETPPPLMAAFSASGLVQAAADHTFNELDSMGPVRVPELPPTSNELHALLGLKHPKAVPEAQKAEFKTYVAARDAHYRARGENQRRIRVLLWTEQWMRANNDPRAAVVREFNRTRWSILDDAQPSCDIRFLQESSVA